MSLQKEITIILLVVIGLFTGLDNAIQRFIIYPSYQKIDQKRARTDMVRFRATLAREIHHVNQLVLDWSARDDTYQFIQGGNKEYLKSNLTENLLEYLEINSMHFVDKTGVVAWRRVLIPGHDDYVEVEHLPGDRFSLDDPLLQHEELESSTSGVLIT
ncbi:MAG: CHASE4 domain-containing protein, partial [Thermodesulfobacteriota bacterium]